MKIICDKRLKNHIERTWFGSLTTKGDKKDMNQNAPIKDATILGWPKMLLLGLQHMFAMFGATILVPILVNSYFEGEGLSVQVTLFCAGVGTLLFHLISKGKVPAFLGSSFAFLGGFAMIAQLDTGIYANMTMGEKLPYACGGVVVAGLLYLVLALIIKLVGVQKVMRLLPPVVTGPIIICIGLSLASSAVSNAETNWLIAVVAFAVIVIFNIWGKGMFKIIPILMGVVISYLFALLLNGAGMTNADGSAILDFSSIASASWIAQPPFFWCKFDITAILVMAPIAIATMMEHIGDMTAISATVGENFIEDPGLHRTLIGDGLATSLSGAIGGPANTTYGENTGVLELSRVHDPRVIRLAAAYAIILSFSPKFAEVIGSMPSSIIGGVSFILYGMISAVGVRNVVENHVDFTKSRNLIIAAVILVSGLGFADGLTFTVGSTDITLTSLAIAAVMGILLNAILPGKDA
jgi:uracil permease